MNADERRYDSVIPAKAGIQLRRAYVEARYNPGYRITRVRLEYLAQRVRKLQRLTKRSCAAKIESYLSE
jgi:hypothetical protein